MSERTFQVSATSLLTGVCWSVGGTLIAASCLHLLDHPWATAGLAVFIFGCTCHVCAAIRGQGVRARDAFELGRESMRLVRD